MRFLGRVFAGIFLAGLTLALLVTAGGMVRNALQERQSREPFRPMRNEQVAAVNVVTFKSGNIQPVITVFGAVQSGRSLELRVPRGGPVVQISPDFVAGGIVAEGALLLSTDSVDEEQAVARATTNLSESEAALAEAKASVLLAQDDLRVTQDQAALRQQALARQKDLLERGAGTEANIETAA
ncbi:MAG TPA: efflux transporter periplasmic adaptor subunit, partial [Paracoccaceae bacterium]|nr:efflux transporter periplasmic adaptor subunit [Paracoccaceae bacterium]